MKKIFLLVALSFYGMMAYGLSLDGYAVNVDILGSYVNQQIYNQKFSNGGFIVNGHVSTLTPIGIVYGKMGLGYISDNALYGNAHVEMDSYWHGFMIGNDIGFIDNTSIKMDSIMQVRYTNLLEFRSFFLQSQGGVGMGSRPYYTNAYSGYQKHLLPSGATEVSSGVFTEDITYQGLSTINALFGYHIQGIQTRLAGGVFYDIMGSEKYIGPKITFVMDDVLQVMRFKKSKWHVGLLGYYTYDTTRKHQVGLTIRTGWRQGSRPFIQDVNTSIYGYSSHTSFKEDGKSNLYTAMTEEELNKLLQDPKTKFIWLNLNGQSYDGINNSMFISKDLKIPEGKTLCASLAKCFEGKASNPNQEQRGTLVFAKNNGIILYSKSVLRDINIMAKKGSGWYSMIKVDPSIKNIDTITITNVATNGYVYLVQNDSDANASYHIDNLSYTKLPDGEIPDKGALLEITSNTLKDTNIVFGTVPTMESDKYDNKATVLKIKSTGDIKEISLPSNGIYRDFPKITNIYLINIDGTNSNNKGSLNIDDFKLNGDINIKMRIAVPQFRSGPVPNPIKLNAVHINDFSILGVMTLTYYDTTVSRYTNNHYYSDYDSHVIQLFSSSIQNITVSNPIILKKWYNDSHIRIFFKEPVSPSTTQSTIASVSDKGFTYPATWQPVHDESLTN